MLINLINFPTGTHKYHIIHIYEEQARFLLLVLSVSQTASFQSS